MEQVKAAGVTIDPSRRMRAKDYPWEHDIQIALPPSYGKTDQRFPVLWVTDGSLLFQLATALSASCARQHIPEMIVVGIGSPPEVSYHRSSRGVCVRYGKTVPGTGKNGSTGAARCQPLFLRRGDNNARLRHSLKRSSNCMYVASSVGPTPSHSNAKVSSCSFSAVLP